MFLPGEHSCTIAGFTSSDICFCVMCDGLVDPMSYSFHDQANKKNICVYGPPTDPNFWPDPKLFMALLVENYLNALFLPFNVVFGV